MFTPFRFSRERTESRTRSTNAFTAFSLTRLPGGTISRTTGVDASASRNGRPMQARMDTRRYLNIHNERGGGYYVPGPLSDVPLLKRNDPDGRQLRTAWSFGRHGRWPPAAARSPRD